MKLSVPKLGNNGLSPNYNTSFKSVHVCVLDCKGLGLNKIVCQASAFCFDL